MELVKPAFGLIFWMFVSFALILFLLKKFAWKPILDMLDEREKTISDALNSAQKAKEEMTLLRAGNEKLLQEARNERDLLLKEAREAKEMIINEAKKNATEVADKMLASARENISNEKMAAITELKKCCYEKDLKCKLNGIGLAVNRIDRKETKKSFRTLHRNCYY